MVQTGSSANGNGTRARIAVGGAGRRIDLSNSSEVERLRKRKTEAWQDEARSYATIIGEIKFAYWYFGSCLSRIRLYVGAQPDPSQSPIDVGDREAATEAQIDSTLAADAMAILNRLHNSETGVSGLLYEAAVNVGVVGECHLVGTDARPEVRDPFTNAVSSPARPESWDIKSIDELEVKGRDTFLKGEDGKAAAQPLNPEETFVARLWQRDPFRSDAADSLMRGVLEACDEYLILSRAIRAAATNRIAMNGLTLISDALHFGPTDSTSDTGDGEGPAVKFLNDLMTAAETAIQNEGTASAAVPVVLSFPGNLDVDKLVKQISFERSIDPLVPELRKECVDRIARGLPLPPERILGHQQTTYANAVQVTIDEFAKHIEPFVTTLVQSLTAGFLWPLLVDAGYSVEDARSVMVWYDPSDLVTKPDQGADADALWDRNAISSAALRRAHNFADTDAPDEEELLQRTGLRRGILTGDLTLALLKLLGVALDVEPLPKAAPVDAPSTEAATAALVAAPAARREPTDVGRRLVEIDRDLRTRLLVATDAAMRRALERAGARLRSKVAANGTVTASLDGVSNPQVAGHIGPAVVAAMGLSDDELLADAFASLAEPFDSWTESAQGAALAVLERVGVALSDDALVELVARQAADRAAGWELLLTGLTQLATQRLYDPSPSAPQLGEHDPDLSVPAGLVRGAMARAGGNGAVLEDGTSADGTLLTGVATGPGVLDAAGQAGFMVEAYRWEYGIAPRRSSFDPHRAIDGVTFESFTDPVLLNPMGWPGPYLLPGDHDGCLCDVVPVMIRQEALAASGSEGAA